MTHQVLFSGKNKKNISKCCLLKVLLRVLSVKKKLFQVQMLEQYAEVIGNTFSNNDCVVYVLERIKYLTR